MNRFRITYRGFLRTLGLGTVSVLLTCSSLSTVAADQKPAAPDKDPSLDGVVILNRYKCDDGYRLYSSRMTEQAHLIDIDGREVHSWTYPQGESWHYAEMLPNGHLVAIIKESENRYPGMIIELDWNSRLVWKADVMAHHDFDRLDNGNTLVVCREYVQNEAIRPGQLKSDVIIELTPDNKVVWEWHGDRHVKKDIAGLVSVKFPLEYTDILHTNTVESLPDGPASRKDSRFKAGNVLFSALHINTIGVIDKDSGRVVWAWGPGVLSSQHMPTMLPNGHILVYDNGREFERTRIIELEPVTEKIVWEYQGDPPESFYSRTRGSNQRLPNGNTFIAESDSGRLFEVTPAGEIVWEFLNPYRHPSRAPERQPLYRAICYPRETVDRLLSDHRVE